jgi:hypothetical protein
MLGCTPRPHTALFVGEPRQYLATVPKEGDLAEPQDTEFRATVQRSNIERGVPSFIHLPRHGSKRILEGSARNVRLYEKDFSLAE